MIKLYISSSFVMPFFLLLSCADTTNLAEIDIVKTDGFSWDGKEESTILYSFEGESVDMPAEIKYRGGHSARYEKHSFSLELVKKYQLTGLPKDDDWILNANYIDKTFMRHKISYDLFRDMNINNLSVASNYVNISINGEAQGLYLITEEINGGQVKLNKTDSQAMIFKDPPFLFETRIPNPQDTNNYYQQKFPKISKNDKSAYLEQFRSLIFESSLDEFSAKIGDWIDIDNVIDWHLLLLYSYNADGILKNFYLYKLDSDTPFRIAIWDYDHTFGRDGDNERNMMERSMRMERSILFTRLLSSKDLDYKERLKKIWAELRNQGVFGIEYMEAKMKDINAKINESVQLNSIIWPWDSKWYYDNNNYEEEKDLFMRFVKLRLDVLDREFDYN
ncbi:MAG: spore coat protein CotH [Saprospiraceae bacterium]|jgi:spore coat protein CotH